MKTLMTVKEFMSFVEDSNSKWVTLITPCSDEEVYSNWYFNLPYEMWDSDVTLIRIEEKDHIILYIL